MFNNCYKDKCILVTGHTGFKGSWLSLWLLELGADVIGYSIDIPSRPSNFEVLNLEKRLHHIRGDINDIEQLNRVFEEFSPDIVFHLAAQSITRLSYDIPHETFWANLGGTVNILECIRMSKSVKAAVIVTSDKCYQNLEWMRGYREDDRLGGDDPYSASKGCAEIACHSYIKSFYSGEDSPRVSTSRPGNAIGGGDWGIDRIIPDCIRAFSKGKGLNIRNPGATRPWQHVLEPLSGYLWLGVNLFENNKTVRGESFNFGPSDKVDRSVEELVIEFARTWKGGKWYNTDTPDTGKKEAILLKLNCDKAHYLLKWRALLPFEDTVRMTADWYMAFYNGEEDMQGFTIRQIERYTNLAQQSGLIWTR